MLTTTSINAAMHAPAMSAGFQRPSVAVADAPPSLPLQASSSEMGSYGTLCRSIAALLKEKEEPATGNCSRYDAWSGFSGTQDSW